MLTLIDNIFPWFGDMLELGGDILFAILMMAALIGALIAERLSYLLWVYPQQRSKAIALWQARKERNSWYAHQFRGLLIARLNRDLQRNISLTRTLIKLCPLLGLLGTVLGMLEVFDAVAATGSNNPRATASGVSKATVTTMAGMVVAIVSMFTNSFVIRRVTAQSEQLNDCLVVDATRNKV